MQRQDQQVQRQDRRLSGADDRRMRQALESFPPGHPSSPYLADGQRRPPEPDMRSMRDYEFKPPPEYAAEYSYASFRDDGSGYESPTDRETRDDAGAESRAESRADRESEAKVESRAESATGGEGRSGDGRDHGATENSQDGGGTTDGRDYGEDERRDDTSHPDERQPPEASAGREASGRSDDFGRYDGSDGSGSYDAPRDPESKHFSYWTEVPRFMRMWGEHEDRWPMHEQPAARVDRSRDPDGSWRSDSNLFLGQKTNDQTNEAIHGVREAEGRVTLDLRQVVQESPVPSAELVGLEFRCKGDDRLKEKVAETIQRRPDMAPEEALRDINDAIRYTVRLDREDYTLGHESVSRNLREQGYEMFYAENHWKDSEYKGINTRWLTPEGQRFEVQFHTRESHHAKQEVTHQAYERIRNPLTGDDERSELKAFQREVSSWIPVPEGATGIPNYRKEHF
jgi:hypothetical protein